MKKITHIIKKLLLLLIIPFLVILNLLFQLLGYIIEQIDDRLFGIERYYCLHKYRDFKDTDKLNYMCNSKKFLYCPKCHATKLKEE